MIRIAASSDNHLDLNKVPTDGIIHQQAQYLTENKIDYYLVAGDLFNDFHETVSYIQQLSGQLSITQVLFIAGNHDMIRNVTYDQLENGYWPGYLNNHYFDIPETNYRIIGLNGWYDYSFAKNTGKTEVQFHQWKMAYWIDSLIKQPMSDPQREGIVIDKLKEQLEMAQKAQKKVILMTHFVPNQLFIRYTGDNRFWNMANAMLGSVKVGQLIDEYAVPIVIFGHIHDHMNPRKIGNTWYYNGAVGYHNHHHNEWQTNTFYSEWLKQLKTIQLF